MLTWVVFFVFLFFIFCNFILQYGVDCELSFIIYFNVFFLWGYLGVMTQVWKVNLGRLDLFFELNLVFNFILYHWVDWELSLIFFLICFFIKLSMSHDSSNRFCRLTRVDPSQFNMLLFKYLKNIILIFFS